MKTHFGYSDDSRWIDLLPIARSVKWADASGEEDLWETGRHHSHSFFAVYQGRCAVFAKLGTVSLHRRLGKQEGSYPARDKAEKAWIAAVEARNKLESDGVNGYENSQKASQQNSRTLGTLGTTKTLAPSLPLRTRRLQTPFKTMLNIWILKIQSSSHTTQPFLSFRLAS